MRDEIIEAWETNDRITRLLLDAIDDEGLGCTLSTRGGRDVARQLGHIHDVRVLHLEKRGRGLADGLARFASKTSPPREALAEALEASGERVSRFLEAMLDGEAKTMKKGVVPYLGYLIAHEAHHRGNILLTLKQCGHAVDKSTRYGIWDWDRR